MSADDAGLTDWLQAREHVRARPGMYIGDPANGIRQIVCELAANTIDCFLAGKATYFSVKAGGRSITVEDDGPGLPFKERFPGETRSLAEQYLTGCRNSPTADGHAPHCHLIFHGVGIAVVNALSSDFSVESWADGTLWKMRFRRGIPSGKPSESPTNRRGSGTRIKVVPDAEMFPDALWHYSELRAIFFESAHLHPGLKISFNGERFLAPGGLADLISIYDSARCNGTYPGQKTSRIFSASVRRGDFMIHAAAFEASGMSHIFPPGSTGCIR